MPYITVRDQKLQEQGIGRTVVKKDHGEDRCQAASTDPSPDGPWCVTFAFDGIDAVDIDLEQYH